MEDEQTAQGRTNHHAREVNSGQTRTLNFSTRGIFSPAKFSLLDSYTSGAFIKKNGMYKLEFREKKNNKMNDREERTMIQVC